MARESTAPEEPLTPSGNPNPLHRPAHIQEPEFGKASPLGSKQRSNHLFNIPKSNRARAEHHRGPQQPNPQAGFRPPGQIHQSAAPQGHRAPVATPATKRSEPWDPFKPVAPSAYNNPRGGFQPGSVGIKRPENVTWNTPRAPRPVFQSKPLPPKKNTASNNLQSFMDLTRDATDTFPSIPRNSTPRAPSSFGAMDMNGYIDSAAANENIKALLEGAFEDEEDKAHTKPQGKKKASRKTQSKKQKDQGISKQSKEPAADDLDDLAAQLSGVTVNESKKTDSEPEALRTEVAKNQPVEHDEADDKSENEVED